MVKASHWLKTTVLLAGWLIVASCAAPEPEPEPELPVTVDVMGIFTDRVEAFVGRSTSYPEGVGLIEVIGVRSGIECIGSFDYRRQVPECRGSLGSAELQCTDGRFILATFVADGCHSGMGIGIDQFGNRFRFTFGKDAEESRRILTSQSSSDSGLE